MELRQLKSLCLIVQFGSVKEAAQRSFLTSSAISLQIKELERELDSKLFERAGRKLLLTPKGEIFYHEARKILESVNEAAEKAKTQSNEFNGRISLAAPACLRYFYLPSFARFRAAYPSIRLTIFARSHMDASSMIQSGEADLAMGLFQRSFRDLKEIPLVRPKLTLIVPGNYASLAKKNIDLRQTARHPLVLLQPSTTTRNIIDAAFRKNHLSLKPEMEASTCTEIKRYVAHGIGMGIIHDICLEPEDGARFRTLNFEKLVPHPAAKLIYNPSKTLTNSEKRFVDFLRFAS